jgi:hypothetical protein
MAVQFLDLYIIANEHNVSIADVWDGVQLNISFRRTVDQVMLNRWYELVGIVESLHLNDEEDAIIWKFEAKGTYSVSSLYAIINFRGVVPVHILAVWKLHVPPRLHVFIWLLANNKLLTRDNLVKRQNVPDLTCVFCSENETCERLFF